MNIARTIVVTAVLAGCGVSQETSAAGSPSSPPTTSVVAPTRSAERTKPPELQIQPPLAAPTHVSWAIDRGAPDDPARRHLFELYFDGAAMGFRIVDASGQLVVQLPIAGSGIFDTSTCMANAKPPAMNATWVALDDATYQRIAANSATYRVVVDTIGVPSVTLPLVDTGCRRT